MPSTIHPFTQARQLESFLDEVYDIACEQLGDNHEVTVRVMMAMARSFALTCDLESFMLEKHDEM